jgi:hypothetical protein
VIEEIIAAAGQPAPLSKTEMQDGIQTAGENVSKIPRVMDKGVDTATKNSIAFQQVGADLRDISVRAIGASAPQTASDARAMMMPTLVGKSR